MVSEYLIEALVAADIRQVCLVVAPSKRDLAEFYGCGAGHGVHLTYVCQETATGMANAVDAAHGWIADRSVVLGMPDTIFQPVDAVLRLRQVLERDGVDLVLGVFPTDEAHRLGPVLLDHAGFVSGVLEKPDPPPVANTWGIACWGPVFTEFLQSDLAAWPHMRGERSLGAVFHASVERGLRVRAVSFDDGLYIDVGTLKGLSAARRAVEQSFTTPSP